MPFLAASLLAAVPAAAQVPGMGGPPSVGIVRAEKQPVTESSEFVGRISAVNRVALVARVTAFLEKQNFTEGAEIHKGDLLYVLEQPPFQADVEAKAAAVSQAEARLENSTRANERQQQLLKTPAGQQSAADAARATMLADAAQVLAAKAQLRQTQINLDYTEIRAPIDGKIGRTAVTIGNVVGPSTGTLATITSQDPMYVVFPVPVRTVIELRQRMATQGGSNAMVIRVRLPDGRIYGQTGKLDFIDNSISTTTDTLVLRGIIPNPVNGALGRELVDNEFVDVILEGAKPVELVAIPRAAVLSDQQGEYVFTVDAQNKVAQKRVTLGQSTPDTATVLTGLQPGEMVIVDGIQKVHPGQVVSPGPAATPPAAEHTAAAGGTASLASRR